MSTANKKSSPARKRTREGTANVPDSTPIAPSSPPLRDDDMAEVADEFEDDMDEVQDLEDIDGEVDGEDLFGETMMRYFFFVRIVLMIGIIGNAQKRISMILRIWMMQNMMILILKHVDESRRNSINETAKSHDVVYSDLPLSLIQVNTS